jgi:hypothetical protein
MALRRRPRTYLEMLMLGISTSPQRRVMESVRHLKLGERIVRKVNGRGLVEWSVMKGKK